MIIKKSKVCFSIILIVMGIGSLFMGTPTRADDVTEDKTELSVSLKRKVLPDKLPGSETTTSKPSQRTPLQSKKRSGTLLKTGSIRNNWALLGILIITLVCIFRYRGERKKLES